MLLPWWVSAALLLLLALWLAATRVGQQTWSVTQVGFADHSTATGILIGGRDRHRRRGGVLVAVLAMGAGFEATLKQTGTDDTAIVLRAGAQSELNSVLDHDSAVVISQMPQVLHDADGQPIASPELVVVASLPKKATRQDANVELRGVGEHAWELRPNLKITAGRKFHPGLRELVAGKGARAQFAGMDAGLDHQSQRSELGHRRRVRIGRCL